MSSTHFFPQTNKQTLMSPSSYPSWNTPSHLPLSQVPVSATTAYPSATTDPYHKLSLSAAPPYSSEQQDLPLQSPLQPVGLNMGTSDHNSQQQQQPQAAMRNAYHYTHTTSSAPPLSITTSALGGSEHGLSVPRYVESSSRPTKSPRHPHQQSVHSLHSSGALANDTSSEYRFGPSSYVQVSTSGTTEPYGATDTSHTPSPAVQHPPSRDFYQSASSWTTSAGETNTTTVPSYTNVLSDTSRPYGFATDPYKSNASTHSKHDHASSGSTYAAGMHNYSWSPSQ